MVMVYCREHLGLLEEQKFRVRCKECDSHREHVDVSDPVSEQFYSSWSSIAAKNLEVYEEVCVASVHWDDCCVVCVDELTML